MHNIQYIFNNLASKGKEFSDSEPMLVHYISNPDGSIRWIWSSDCKSALFLKFYHIQGLKAFAFATIVRLIFVLRIQRWLFKKEKVQIHQPTLSYTIELKSDQWALFTGTTGPNQKYVLYQQNRTEKGGTFTKIALSPQSQSLINNERSAIGDLAQVENLSFHFSDILNSDLNSITFMENTSFMNRINQWSDQHALFLKSIKKINTKEYSFEDFDKIHQLSSRIKNLSNYRKKLPSGIVKKLNYLHQSLQNSTVETHLAHGDFTPWNMYSDKEGILYIYDWELSSAAFPKLFDFYHFIFQNSVLVQKKNWKEIKAEMAQNSTFFESNIEFQKYLSLYLLINVLNYLEIYEKQSTWHTQINWLLETWNMALSDVLSSSVMERELVILDIFDHLHQKKYAGLKLADQPEKVSEYSDIDLLISKSVSVPLQKMLEIHPLVKKMKTQRGFAMTKITLLTQQNHILCLDNIHRLKRKNLEYMSVEKLTERPYIDNKGIKKVGLMDTIGRYAQ